MYTPLPHARGLRGATPCGILVSKAMGHWGFVLAAYVLTAGVLVLYWRWVERRLREVEPRRPRSAG